MDALRRKNRPSAPPGALIRTSGVAAPTGRLSLKACPEEVITGLSRFSYRPDGRPRFTLGVGFDITELKRTEQQLQERTESLQKLSTKLFQVQDQERRRIARDLHDGIGQYLVALNLNFEIFSSSQLADDGGLLKESERLLERKQ